ncbi:hypothetical protein CVT25_011495 [Psilocybe cyanescens]|uniref:F-box domain-containing protein n=1 Tax=Psilocybe cyanescens TaxID=93625 RepID=A0A409XA62_PSICY|nr:hypothetical protein CVT25_011495 [Psilocybe cyanescens]
MLVAHKPSSLSRSYDMPQEITDLFVYAIAQHLDPKSSRQSLISCTMVSRSFSLPARRQLYSAVHVSYFKQGNGPTDKQAPKYSLFKSLKEKLEGPTNFGSLIRKVHIDVSQSLIPLADDVELHSVFSALRIHSLNVDCFWMTGNNDTTWWSDMSLEIICLLASWTQLAKIRISHVRDLTMDFLPSLSVVSCLELVSIHFNNSASLEERDLDSEVTKPLQLHELFVHRSHDGFQEFRNRLQLDLSSLRRFQMSIFDRNEALIFSAIIQGSFKSLQLLDLYVNLSFSAATCILRKHLFSMLYGTDNKFLKGGIINIGNFSNLRKLRLRIQTGIQQIFPSMSDIFSLLHPPSKYPTRLEAIELLFNSIRGPGRPPQIFAPDTMNDSDADAWRSLHPTVLRQPHPNLRSLYLCLDLMIMKLPSWAPIDSSLIRDAEGVLAGKFKAYIEGSSEAIDRDILAWDIHAVAWENDFVRK